MSTPLGLVPSYEPPFWLRNAHTQTIVPALYRRVNFPFQKRFSIATPDDDLLWADYFPANGDTLAILSHGLEGSSERHYVLGMAKALAKVGVSSLAWNYRGCLNGPNKRLRFYHSGATDDLHTVCSWADKQWSQFQKFIMIGFSLGGNLSLKYLGENFQNKSEKVMSGIAISVPLDLAGSSDKISRGLNRIYEQRFISHLKAKVKAKAVQYLELNTPDLNKVKKLRDFDDAFTAPLHGFRDAAHYYRENSSLYFLEGIKVPTLIIQSQDDPMLSATCFPTKSLEKHHHVSLLITPKGGHVGFITQLGLQAESHAEKLSCLWVSQFK